MNAAVKLSSKICFRIKGKALLFNDVKADVEVITIPESESWRTSRCISFKSADLGKLTNLIMNSTILKQGWQYFHSFGKEQLLTENSGIVSFCVFVHKLFYEVHELMNV